MYLIYYFYSLIAVLNLTAKLFDCEQIKSRFKSKDIPKGSYNCVFGVQMVNGISVKEYLSKYDLVESVSKGTNATIRHAIDAESNGLPFKNGTYTGMIGQIQRHEYDIAFSAIRPDSIPYDPVLVGPSFLAADAIIISVKSKSNTWIVDTVDMVENFDLSLYAYIAISIYIAVTLITVATLLQEKSDFVTMWLNNLWNAFEALIGQENFSPTIWSVRIMWLFYCIAVFITVLGYLLNLMSTDMVAEYQKPMINSLRDLLSPEFANYTPVIFKQAQAYNLLVSEHEIHPNSQVGQLYQRMSLTANKSFFEININDKVAAGNAISSLITHEVISGNAALIFPQNVWLTYEPMLCQLQPETTRKVHISSSSLLEGTFNIFFSKLINPHLRKLLEYRFRNVAEFGILKSALARSIESTCADMGMELTFDRFKCMLEDLNKKTETKEPNALKLGNTTRTWIMVGYVISLASISLVAELIVRWLSLKLETLKRCFSISKRRERKPLDRWHELRNGIRRLPKLPTKARQPQTWATRVNRIPSPPIVMAEVEDLSNSNISKAEGVA